MCSYCGAIMDTISEGRDVMKAAKLIIFIIVFSICTFVPIIAVSAHASYVPRINIMALSLTLDLVLIISLCAIISAAVCIGLKLYKKNHKLYK